MARRRKRRNPRPGAVVLAGGRGVRLAPMTAVLPKPLLPMGDAPILALLLRQLRAHGWRDVTLAVGYHADLIRAYCGSGGRFNMNVRYLQETSPLGTVGPLAFLPDEMRRKPLLVMNGDLLTTFPYADFVDAHRSSGARISVALFNRRVHIDFGVAELDGQAGRERRVLNLREKPSIDAPVSMGIYVIEPEALALIRPGVAMDVPDLIARVLAEDGLVGGYEFDGYWLDIGRHADYEAALEEYEGLRGELLPAHEEDT
jgi:NDP-mannose synthase